MLPRLLASPAWEEAVSIASPKAPSTPLANVMMLMLVEISPGGVLKWAVNMGHGKDQGQPGARQYREIVEYHSPESLAFRVAMTTFQISSIGKPATNPERTYLRQIE